jgi:hypothetical protein
MIISMAIAVPWENLGHLLQHEVDGLVLLEEQAGEVDVQLQLSAQLPGPKCSDSYSSHLVCWDSFRVWLGSCRAKVKNSRTDNFTRGRLQESNELACKCRYTPRATAGILSSEDPSSETKQQVWVLHAGSWELGKAQDNDEEVDLVRDIVKREENLHTRSKLLVQAPPKEIFLILLKVFDWNILVQIMLLMIGFLAEFSL